MLRAGYYQSLRRNPDRPRITIVLKSPRCSTQGQLDKRELKRNENAVFITKLVWQISC
jgi:hypothetical protein